MKLFFLADDSLYKIFKTLEKIPKWKQLEISIDSHHSLFDNEWWWKQIKEVLKKRNLDITFVTKTEKSKIFFESLWLKTNHIEKNKFIKVIKLLYLFIFDIKKFHLHSSNKRNSYNFILVIWFEAFFVFWILYLLYSLILPGVKIEISPSKQIETIIYNFRYYPSSNSDYPRYSRFISIPFYTGKLEYTHDMSINTVNIKYLQNPSSGIIKIFNNTEKKYSFVPNTRFITDDGRLFKTTNWVDIPAWYKWVPWEKIIKVKAMDKDDSGIMMWKRGNISNGTKLYVKNLKQSLFLKELYAVAMEDFTWWNLTSDWVVTQEDIALLSDRLKWYITQQKKNIVVQNFNNKNDILLAFDNTIFTKVNKIEIPYITGQKTSIIWWSIVADIWYMYIKWDDLINSFSTYVKQRPSEKTLLTSIDKNSLVFFDDDEVREEDGTFIIPTKIDVIQAYDFEKDVNGIVDDIKAHIDGGDVEEARGYILHFPEISSVNIKITPIWYSTIPKVKSRIKVWVEK